MEKEGVARAKEDELREQRNLYNDTKNQKEEREEQFYSDEHTYKKEIEGLRDRNCELVLRQQELAQEYKMKEQELQRMEREMERIDE